MATWCRVCDDLNTRFRASRYSKLPEYYRSFLLRLWRLFSFFSISLIKVTTGQFLYQHLMLFAVFSHCVALRILKLNIGVWPNFNNDQHRGSGIFVGYFRKNNSRKRDLLLPRWQNSLRRRLRGYVALWWYTELARTNQNQFCTLGIYLTIDKQNNPRTREWTQVNNTISEKLQFI